MALILFTDQRRSDMVKNWLTVGNALSRRLGLGQSVSTFLKSLTMLVGLQLSVGQRHEHVGRWHLSIAARLRPLALTARSYRAMAPAGALDFRHRRRVQCGAYLSPGKEGSTGSAEGPRVLCSGQLADMGPVNELVEGVSLVVQQMVRRTWLSRPMPKRRRPPLSR